MPLADYYRIEDLEKYNRQIEELVEQFGLNCYPQEYELVSYEDMLSYEAYLGLPTRYPHWSFGKAYERKTTFYRYNLTGLPYEMVINSSPCLAYLMKENSLLLQIFTMAHVYGHNDFFKNNRHFSQGTRADMAIEMFNAHARRIREYAGDPSIGSQRVEKTLDAAHTLRFQTYRIAGEKHLSREQIKHRLIEKSFRPPGEHPLLEEDRVKPALPDLDGPVLEPEDDILGFLSREGRLNDWQRDIVRMVREESLYFLPQVETKTMNEGWASYWHYKILQALDLPPALHLEFLERHNQVVSMREGFLNPYYLGFKIFTRIAQENGSDSIFQVRELERDASFFMRYLDKELCEEMQLFQYFRSGREYVVSEVADEEGWKKIRQVLARQAGINGIPNIRVHSVGENGSALHLKHEWDGRELQLDYALPALRQTAYLWGGKVFLHTRIRGNNQVLESESNSG
ncbi:MAG: SpoVR family protein [Syntrophomonas sp.]